MDTFSKHSDWCITAENYNTKHPLGLSVVVNLKGIILYNYVGANNYSVIVLDSPHILFILYKISSRHARYSLDKNSVSHFSNQYGRVILRP